MTITALLTERCVACDAPISVGFKWSQGSIVPLPSQVRISLLEWSAEDHELVEMKLAPDVGVLIMCEKCRAEFVAEIIAAFMKLSDKKPAEKREATVN